MGRSLIQSTLILMGAAAFNRVIGFIYQAIIYRTIGAEGMGLINLVYPIYILITVIATAGIPLGISKMVSEEHVKGSQQKIFNIFWVSFIILAASGLFFTLETFLISPWFQKYLFPNKMAFIVFCALIPGIFIVSISSAMRGFFQGLMNMKPPALGQVVEQLTRFSIGLFLAQKLLPQGIHYAAMGIASASVIGELTGFLVLLIYFIKNKPVHIKFVIPDVMETLSILRSLVSLCTPITLGRIATTILLTVDSILIPVLLRNSGLSISQATAAYGQLTGVAMTLLFIPSIVTVSLATSMVPAMSEAVARNNHKIITDRIRSALKFTIITGVPFIAVYLAIPDEIIKAIFGSSDLNHLLSTLAFGGLFAYLQQSTTGIIQGMGFPEIPLKNMLFAGILKIGCLLALGYFHQGISAMAWSYVVFYVASSVLNLHYLKSKTISSLKLGRYMIISIFLGTGLFFMFRILYDFMFVITHSNTMSMAMSVLSGFATYAAILLFFFFPARYKNIGFYINK